MIRYSLCRGHRLQLTLQIRFLRSSSSHPESLGLQRDAWKRDSEDAYLGGATQIVIQPSTYFLALKRIKLRISQSFTFPSVQRNVRTRDKTAGRHLNISLLISKSLNLIVCGCLAVLGFIFTFEYLMQKLIGDKTEDGIMMKEDHDYYSNLNQSKAQRLPDSA